jgi:hypothetical protein
MKFKIKAPCEVCPFRRDVAPFLHRATQIAKTLSDDRHWFACHETTGVKSGRRVRPENQSQCAGSMRVLARMGRPNIAMRLAHFMRLIDIAALACARKPPVFASLKAFERYHSRG